MSKRMFLVAVLVAALAAPAVVLADDGGGNTPAPAAGARHGRAGEVLERISRRLDRRFDAFSKHCLVAAAPERCSRAADHFVDRLGRLQAVLVRVKGRITTRCSAANPPPRCRNATALTQKIDTLLATIASDQGAIKAAFPNAGTT